MTKVNNYENLESKVREIYKSELDPKYLSVDITQLDSEDKGWDHNDYKVNICQKIPVDVEFIPNGTYMLFQLRYTLRTMHTGCGSMIFHGWSNIHDKISSPKAFAKNKGYVNLITDEELIKWNLNYKQQFLDTWNLILDDLRAVNDTGPGVIITTAGETYYPRHEEYSIDDYPAYKVLTEWLGFKVVDEYNNHQHGSDYKQRLLSLHI